MLANIIGGWALLLLLLTLGSESGSLPLEARVLVSVIFDRQDTLLAKCR
jgi:hypothetical protein